MGCAEDFVNYISLSKVFFLCILSGRKNAILNLCTTITVQIQKNTDNIKELRSKVAELHSDVRQLEHRMEDLEKGQLSLDDRLSLMENRSEIQQIQMRQEPRLMDEKRFQRLEDCLFHSSANAA